MSMDVHFWTNFFDDSNYFTGPPLTQEMIREAETQLGYNCPSRTSGCVDPGAIAHALVCNTE